MPKKQEERDWTEIMAEVRSKARSEVEEFVDEIRPRVQALVSKVRKANFHEEADELLTKLRKLTEDFTKSPEKPKSKPAAKRKRPPIYRDEDGKEYGRAPNGWTAEQKEKYRIR